MSSSRRRLGRAAAESFTEAADWSARAAAGFLLVALVVSLTLTRRRSGSEHRPQRHEELIVE